MEPVNGIGGIGKDLLADITVGFIHICGNVLYLPSFGKTEASEVFKKVILLPVGQQIDWLLCVIVQKHADVPGIL